MFAKLGALCTLSICLMIAGPALAEDNKPSPAEGFTIHVIAPHKFEDGTVHGPYHHYCKITVRESRRKFFNVCFSNRPIPMR